MRLKSFDRAIVVALSALMANVAVADVTWDFEANSNSDLGGVTGTYAGHYAGPTDDTIALGFVGGTAPTPGAALSITGNHVPAGGFSGVNFFIKPGGAAYNAVNTTSISFDAKLTDASQGTGWGVALLSNNPAGYSTNGGDTINGLTATFQHFTLPITINMRADPNGNGNESGTQVDTVDSIAKIIFSPQTAGSFGLVVDNLKMNGPEGSTYVPPAVTHFDSNYDNGTSVTNTSAGSTAVTGGQVVVDSGGDGGTPGGQITGTVQGGQLQTQGSFTSGGSAAYYYITIAMPFQSGGSFVDLSGNSSGSFGIEYTASKNGADTTGNWFIRLEDTIGPNYTNYHPQLILDGQPHFIPIARFTAGSTDPVTAAATQGTRGTDLTKVTNATVFTEYASQPAAFQNGTTNLHNYVETTTLRVDRVRLVNGANVSDWSIY